MKKQTLLTIPVDHPAFAGHFPGMPIVPGVILLDEVVHAISRILSQPLQAWQIGSAKFLSPLQPGACVVIEHEVHANGTVHFNILEDEHRIVTGSMRL